MVFMLFFVKICMFCVEWWYFLREKKKWVFFLFFLISCVFVCILIVFNFLSLNCFKFFFVKRYCFILLVVLFFVCFWSLFNLFCKINCLWCWIFLIIVVCLIVICLKFNFVFFYYLKGLVKFLNFLI